MKNGLVFGSMALILIIIFAYINQGREAYPMEIHHLRYFAAEHGLHYRATHKQDGSSEPYWCIEMWPIGKHWWSDDSWYEAGIRSPQWQSCRLDVAQAIADVQADVSENPAGHYLTLTKTLQKCEH